jgi:hypothetical protein
MMLMVALTHVLLIDADHTHPTLMGGMDFYCTAIDNNNNHDHLYLLV